MNVNNLGGMVFIVAGIAMGYWVAKGRATAFLHAINFGTVPTSQDNTQNTNTQQNPNPPLYPVSIPTPVLQATFPNTTFPEVPDPYAQACNPQVDSGCFWGSLR